jgi:hypothetical protein
MRKSLTLFIISFLPLFGLFGQTPLTVADNDIEVPPDSVSEFYYGFAEGDQLVFNFHVEKGKELKEIEISEYPSDSKFIAKNSKKIENKVLQIPKTAVYKFRFVNEGKSTALCSVKILRIPGSDATKDFDPQVYWKTLYDTSWTAESEDPSEKPDTVIKTLLDQLVHVYPSVSTMSNREEISFFIPASAVSCSFYIDVDTTGKEALTKTGQDLYKKETPFWIPNGADTSTKAKALNSGAQATGMHGRDSVVYYITNDANANLFRNGQTPAYLKTGKVVNYSEQMASPGQGEYNVCLLNDNNFDKINVTVKVLAMVEVRGNGTSVILRTHYKSRREPYLNWKL